VEAGLEVLDASFAAIVDAESPCLLSFCKTLKAFGLLTRPACFVSGVDGVLGEEASAGSVNRRRAAMALMALGGGARPGQYLSQQKPGVIHITYTGHRLSPASVSCWMT
jgi:hypothetical protein